MRDVDTGVLKNVSRSLGVGAPISAVSPTIFDDGNVQQIWDATKFGAFPVVRACFQRTFSPALGTIAREQFNFTNLFERTLAWFPELVSAGLEEPGDTDVWLTGVQALVLDGDQGGIDDFIAAARGNGVLGADEPLLVMRGATVQTTIPVENTGLYLYIGENADQERTLPLQLTRTDDPPVLMYAADADAAAGWSGIVQFMLVYTMKDAPIWYELGGSKG